MLQSGVGGRQCADEVEGAAVSSCSRYVGCSKIAQYRSIDWDASRSSLEGCDRSFGSAGEQIEQGEVGKRHTRRVRGCPDLDAPRHGGEITRTPGACVWLVTSESQTFKPTLERPYLTEGCDERIT
jgi:hypothetical protein